MFARRSFLKNGILAGLGGIAMPQSFATTTSKPLEKGKPFKNLFAFHQGMFTNQAGQDFLDEIRFAYDIGFRAIEDNGLTGRTPEMQTKIGELLTRLGMTMGVFVVNKGGNGANTLAAGKTEHVDIFLKGCRQAVEVAKRVNAKWVTVVPGDFERRLPIGVQTGNVIEALRKGAEILEPHNLVMVLEPLSDTPDLSCARATKPMKSAKGWIAQVARSCTTSTTCKKTKAT